MRTTFLSIFLSPQYWAILLPSIVAVLIFVLTKRAERDSEWRKEKLKLYLKFMESISGITDSEITNEGEIAFAKACNDLHSLAPIRVIKALHFYQDKIRISNLDSTADQKNLALENLYYEIRRDLKIRQREKRNEYELLLWTSGKKK